MPRRWEPLREIRPRTSSSLARISHKNLLLPLGRSIALAASGKVQGGRVAQAVYCRRMQLKPHRLKLCYWIAPAPCCPARGKTDRDIPKSSCEKCRRKVSGYAFSAKVEPANVKALTRNF